MVISGYILIKYGPQIAQNLQQQQAAAAPPPAATGTAPPATTGTAAPAPASPPVNITFTNPSVTPDTQVPGASLGIFPTAPSRFQGVNLAAPFTQNPQASAVPTCVSNTQDAACGDKGHPKCCPGQTLLGSPLQMVAGSGPAVSTRTPKATPPPRTAAPKGGTLNPQCEGNPCGVTIPGKCLQSTTGTMVTCTQSSKVAYANVGAISRSYLTQVVNGKPRTTIDPFFPAGWYNTQANYRGSLKEPGIRGGI